jgi:hypothetical protein
MVGRWTVKPASYGQCFCPSQGSEGGASRDDHVSVRWFEQTREPTLHRPVPPIVEQLDEARGKPQPKGRGRSYVRNASSTWSLRLPDGIADDATSKLTQYAPSKRTEVPKRARLDLGPCGRKRCYIGPQGAGRGERLGHVWHLGCAWASYDDAGVHGLRSWRCGSSRLKSLHDSGEDLLGVEMLTRIECSGITSACAHVSSATPEMEATTCPMDHLAGDA